MISRIHRFHGHNSLNHVYRTGKTERSEFIVLKHARANRNDYRLAVVVSKKVSKSAVVRNRIRRRLYELVREIRKETEQSWPNDIVLTVFDESVAKMPPEQLRSAVTKLLQKSQILT